MSARKSFSADRSKTADEETSSATFNEFANKTYKVCSSASYENARGRRLQERHVDSVFSDEISLNYTRLNLKDDQKLFLNASQTLEKLNKLIAQNTTVQHAETLTNHQNTSHLMKTSLKEIVLYHDQLKKLLEERSTLMLKEECDICIKKTYRLTNDIKHLYLKEKLKMMMMPIQASNRFISSSDISISAVQLLLKKLQIICDLQSSVNSSYQKIINFFHVVLDLDLYQMVLRTNRVLKKLNSSLFYWAFKSMELFMQKLCLADPHSVSPEFLEDILENCQVFNSLLKDNEDMRQKHKKSSDLFYDYVKCCEYKELSFSSVLSYLAFYEGKVAAEKVVHTLTSTCKKCRQIDLKRNRIVSNDVRDQKIDSNTSDYCSDLDTGPSLIKEHSFKNTNSSFLNVFASITQRNQSLVLKYLFAITSLCSSKSFVKRRVSYESGSKVYSARQMWSVPEQNFSDDNRVLLEQKYWGAFWNNLQKFTLEVLLEVPYHQYGDTKAGTIILWPDSFLRTLFESLKLITENSDITFEGRQIMKEVYENIFIKIMQVSWDKEFSSAVSVTNSHLCTPVPTALNQVRTHPGNILYICFTVVMGIFKEVHDLNSLLYLKCLQALLSTLDCALLWLNTKTRAVASSRNLATYLLITCSDCSCISNLLKETAVPFISNEDCTYTYVKVTPKYLLEKDILKQVNNIYDYNSEAPNIIYKICFSTLKEALTSTLKFEKSWKQCFSPKLISLDIQEDLIFLLTEVVNHLSNVSPVIVAITSAFAQASIYSLQSLRKPLNQYSICLVSTELSKHFQWIERLNLSAAEKFDLKQLICVKKLNFILHCIQASTTSKSCLRHRNRIMPSVSSETVMDESLLSDHEKEYWQNNSRRLFHLCF